MIQCNKDCLKCKHLNTRTGYNSSYPFGYECMRYGDSVFSYQFHSTKVFSTNTIQKAEEENGTD